MNRPVQLDIEGPAFERSEDDWPFGDLPRGGFGAIASDPPWRFRTWNDTNQDRSASRYYDLMTTDAIKALPVQSLAAPNCVLFLWAVNPMIPQALEVMDAWGFAFKTIAFAWAKTTPKTDISWAPKYHVGLGYWTRANIEVCLLGVRGQPKRKAKDVRQLIVSSRREHSRKPDDFFKSVERLVDGPYLEMFARQERPNWCCWGNQTDKFNAPIEEMAL